MFTIYLDDFSTGFYRVGLLQVGFYNKLREIQSYVLIFYCSIIIC